MSTVFTKHLFTITDDIAMTASSCFIGHPVIRAEYVRTCALCCLSTIVLLHAKHGAKDAEAMDITFTNDPTEVVITIRWVVEDGVDTNVFANSISYYLAKCPQMLSPNVVAIRRVV